MTLETLKQLTIDNKIEWNTCYEDDCGDYFHFLKGLKIILTYRGFDDMYFLQLDGINSEKYHYLELRELEEHIFENIRQSSGRITDKNRSILPDYKDN